MKGRGRGWAMGAVAVFAVCLAAAAIYRFSSQGFRWTEFLAGLRSLDPGWAALSLLLSLMTYGARVFRWRRMMRPVRPGAGLWSLASATAVGFTAVIFFGRPGEFVRPWLIARREKVTFSSQLAAWFLERIFDLLSVVLLFGAALVGLGRGEGHIYRILRAGGWMALAAGLGCVGFLVFSGLYSEHARALCDRLARWLPARVGETARRSLDSFLDGLACTARFGDVVVILLWTIVEWGLVCAGMYSLFQAFAPTAEFGWNDTLVFTGFVAFGSVIQLPGIGGGLQVASVLILTELFGLNLEAATACTLLVWGISWLSVMPFGLAFAAVEGVKWGSLRAVGDSVDAKSG